MSSNWDELIDRLLARELSLDSDEVRAACRDEAFVTRLDETLESLAALDEELVLSQARVDADNEPQSEVASLVRGALGPKRSARMAWLVPLLGAAAAAMVLFGLFLGERGPSEVIQPIPMGSQALQCMSPTGNAADFSLFVWVNEKPGGSYEVEITGSDGSPLEGATSGPLGDVREWRASPEFVATWPADIIWQVHWSPPGGGRNKTVFAEASR